MESDRDVEPDYSARFAREYLLSLDYAIQDALSFRRTQTSGYIMILFAFVFEFAWASFLEFVAMVMTTMMVTGITLVWLIKTISHGFSAQ